MWQMSAAHRTLPFGTRLRVTNLANGRVANVVVDDRGPFVADRILDLSRGAAEALDSVGPGVVPVRIETEKMGDGMVDAPCWEVQVGAFARPENVAHARDQLAGRGLASRVAPAGGGLTRVRVTGVGDRHAALRLASRLIGDFPGAAAVPCGGGGG
jgi:rare lipoprotein A